MCSLVVNEPRYIDIYLEIDLERESARESVMSHLKICVQRGENMYTMLIAQLSVSNLKRLFQVRLVL